MDKKRLGGGWVRAIYSVFLSLTLPFIYLYLWWHGRNNQAYRRRWKERGAWQTVSASDRGSIIIHCVSVGELMAARPFIDALLNSYPKQRVTITCTTPTGSDLIRNVYGSRVYHCYLPFDTPLAVGRFLWRLQPRAIVILETEVWPNLVAQSAQRGVPVGLINARMSDRSAQGYKKAALLMRPVWRGLALAATQNAVTAEHLESLGVPKPHIKVTGNLKFDIAVDSQTQAQISNFRNLLQPRSVISAGSTHDGEEQIILSAFSKLLRTRPGTLLILVPRHRERFDEVAALIEQAGLELVRRSQGRPITPTTQVFLADSMGEMMLWYGVSDIATVGGSLIPRGGHNPLEPMVFGLPVVSGRHVFNFKELYQSMDARQAVRWVSDSNDLYQTWLGLLTDPASARQIGAQAQQLFASHRGATQRTLSAVTRLIYEGEQSSDG